MSPPKHVHETEIGWDERIERDGTEFRQKRLGAAAGAEDIGCSLYEIEPGSSGWPYHYHYANEEGMYVLEGTITLHSEGDTVALEAGSYAAFPTGEEGGHELVNETDETVRLLMFATMDHPDVEVFPDSNKVGVMVGGAPGDAEVEWTKYFPADADADFWDGEPGDPREE